MQIMITHTELHGDMTGCPEFAVMSSPTNSLIVTEALRVLHKAFECLSSQLVANIR